MSSAPLLMDVTIDGKPRKVVAVPSKTELALCVRPRHRSADLADRGTPGAAVGRAGREDLADAAACPTKPPAYARNYLKMPDDLIDFTPEMRAQALESAEALQERPLFNPAMLGNVNGMLGAINIGNAGGGTNWPGSSFDPRPASSMPRRPTPASARSRCASRRRDSPT